MFGFSECRTGAPGAPGAREPRRGCSNGFTWVQKEDLFQMRSCQSTQPDISSFLLAGWVSHWISITTSWCNCCTYQVQNAGIAVARLKSRGNCGNNRSLVIDVIGQIRHVPWLWNHHVKSLSRASDPDGDHFIIMTLPVVRAWVKSHHPIIPSQALTQGTE